MKTKKIIAYLIISGSVLFVFGSLAKTFFYDPYIQFGPKGILVGFAMLLMVFIIVAVLIVLLKWAEDQLL